MQKASGGQAQGKESDEEESKGEGDNSDEEKKEGEEQPAEEDDALRPATAESADDDPLSSKRGAQSMRSAPLLDCSAP